MTRNGVLDFAIVGAGVAGLYTAWRLAGNGSDGAGSIGIFEASNRVGGRLWSVGMERGASIPAELGGMFFSDAQPLVHDLCTNALALDTEVLSPKPDFAYVRGRRFRIADLDDSKDLPYNLAKDELGLTYAEIMVHTLLKIAPDLKNYWPMAKDRTQSETIAFLRDCKVENRPLCEWGFWNLLSRSMSNEAYICVRDLVSSYSFFANWNAYDAILSLLNEMTGDWYKLPRGYQCLPAALHERIERCGVPVNLEHAITRISEIEDGLLGLTIDSPQGERTIRARRVILTVSKPGLVDIFRGSALPETERVEESLASIESVPACKIFLSFKEPWWRNVPEGPGQIDSGTFAVSHTDLPMRQCYYLGVDPETNEGLLLASFGDAQSVPFWSTLASDSGRSGQLTSDLPAIARREICRQLSEMHGVEVPEPDESIFVDWSCKPYQGAWHAWRPGWKSWEVMDRLRRPVASLPLYICGESLCAHQGWVEGALASSECMLQQHFDLSRPKWLSSDDALAAYRP